MTKVKICGLSRVEDIIAVNSAKPDFIGFVFAPSRRRVELKTAAMLKERLDAQIKAVGVFVNEEIEIIADLCRNGIIDMIQLHGDEDAETVMRLKELCGCPVIKAIGVGSELPALPDVPDYLLFDTLSEQRGGTGKTFDWSVLNRDSGLPYFLAGGLTLANVTEAITLLSPYCVDVSGGVETDGLKDSEKIEEFVILVKNHPYEASVHSRS